MIRIGLVDFDTSHVQVFTQLLNHADLDPQFWVEGGRVAAGYPGDSLIMPERIPQYRAKLESLGVPMVERPEELIGRVDAVMVESQQGSRHLERALPFLRAGLPVFVDKPFAAALDDADAMIREAEAHGAPLMSCSALRFDPAIAEARHRIDECGDLLSAEAYGPGALHAGNPGLLHYGIHTLEVLFALMGPGCVSARAARTDVEDLVIGRWESGHSAVCRCLRTGSYEFGFTCHYRDGHWTGRPGGMAYYAGMLRAFVRMCDTGEPPFPPREARDLLAWMLAADESIRLGGAEIPVQRAQIRA